MSLMVGGTRTVVPSDETVSQAGSELSVGIFLSLFHGHVQVPVQASQYAPILDAGV